MTHSLHSVMNANSFSGQSVWVTGAGQGIGLAIAESFHALGAEVIGFDCQFTQNHYPFTQQVLDITDADEVAAVCQKRLDAEQGPNVLVNAAGILRLGTLDELSIADWQACFNVNVSGPYYLLRALMPHFKAWRRGSIVNLASNAVHVPRLNMGAYCASKAALASLSHCVGLELAEYGVRCNLVSPGSTDTPMLRSMLGGARGHKDMFDENSARTIAGLPEQYKLGIPLKKIALPQEIANVVVFLASDLASHITMQDIVVDGGATLAA